MNPQQTHQYYSEVLFADAIATDFDTENYQLAHYTSFNNLDAILRSQELWLSNPLYMNDHEELKSGMETGLTAFLDSQPITAACETAERRNRLVEEYLGFYNEFMQNNLIDVYLFCFSQHERKCDDGKLSMWRGYGSNGNGVSLVFEPKGFQNLRASELIFNKVFYGTKGERHELISNSINRASDLIKNTPTELLYIAAWNIFHRIKLFSIFSKHRGFEEELEWRIVYFPERDPQKKLSDQLSYITTERGLDPKLKLNLEAENKIGLPPINQLIAKIIIGPTVSSPIAQKTMERMILHAKLMLNFPIVTSTIRYRGKGG